MSSYETFQFIPRPEAKAMQWNHLVPPVQSAVRELLLILDGAVRHSLDKDVEFANCFLVDGERGTGKTSVLLNARKAVEDQESFFVSLKEDQQLGGEVSGYAETINTHAVWLDILDLEPLQAETNLLTTVLTRIRKALTQLDGQDGGQEMTSLFEASPDSARPLLERLIGDATLMWENIKEQDTRNIANRQVAAAGIYAGYKERFRKAMDKLTEELGRPYGKNARRSIILPIDNIDRSTEHLYSIVKLSQLISHPHLWLVMAGGREDISTFLERAYWKELIRNSNAPSIYGALGRIESNGEDETLTIARRQAATTAQKIWPSSHRIVVPFMQPEQTLAFVPPSQNNLESIEDLLRKVNIPTWLKIENKPIQLPFIGLFEHIGIPFGISDLKNNESNEALINCFEKLKSIDVLHETKKKFITEYIVFFKTELKRKKDHGKSREENERKKALVEKYVIPLSVEISPEEKEKFLNECVDLLKADLKQEKNTNEIVALFISLINAILVTEKDPIYRNSSQDQFKDVILRNWIKKECAKYDTNADDRIARKEDRWAVRFLNKAILQDVFSGVFSRSLTLAARNGLRMPARSVIELWQTANWVVHDETYFNANGHDKVEQIIRTMLRNAIEESSLSSRVSRSLQENVIRKCVNGGTLLNFRKLKLEVECVAPNDTEIRLKEPNGKPLNYLIQSCIRVKRGNESYRRFKLREEATVKDGKELEEELPELVSAWLSILYDVLSFAERLAILRRVLIPPPKMAAQHSVVMLPEDNENRFTTIEKDLQWPAPAWNTFRAQSLFWRRWTNFQLKAEQEWQDWSDNIDNNTDDVEPDQPQSGNNHATADNSAFDTLVFSSYLVIGWVRCILDTYADMHWYSGCDEGKHKEWPSKILEKLPQLYWPKQGMKDLTALGTLVLVQAAAVHWCLSNCMDKPLHRRKHFDIQEMLDWLELELPMFNSHWYLPIDNTQRSDPRFESRFESYMDILENEEELTDRLNSLQNRGLTLKDDEIDDLLIATTELAKSWKSKLPFIVATMEDRIAQLFEPKEDETDHDRALRQKEHQYFLREINRLCSLHKYLAKLSRESANEKNSSLDRRSKLQLSTDDQEIAAKQSSNHPESS